MDSNKTKKEHLEEDILNQIHERPKFLDELLEALEDNDAVGADDLISD